jgi:hypothetical protein
MNPNLAEEHLQTIRTLMERSALYRRALAPIMLVAGILGLLAAAVGIGCRIEAPRSFAFLWLSTAVIVVAAAFVLARRQAFKDNEPFWSPPTFRVGQALLPPLLCGMFVGIMLILINSHVSLNLFAVLLWLLFYGCALHSAGFFMVRGIKWLGWIFIACAIGFALITYSERWSGGPLAPHWIMGVFFGGLHLAYGVYLYFTEKKTSSVA